MSGRPAKPAPGRNQGREGLRAADWARLSRLVRDLALMGKGLADENRLRILLCVARGRKSVSRVVEEVELSQPLVSHHLRELRRAGLVTVEREGPFVFYEVAGPEVLEALAALADLL